MPIREVELNNPQHHRLIADIWSQACGAPYSISPNFVRYNLLPITGLEMAARFAFDPQGLPAGFAIASVLGNEPAVSSPSHGWIDAVAVTPAIQRQGRGGELLSWAEAWLVAQGCTQATLGGGIHTFAPGLPADQPTKEFFLNRGYLNGETEDVRLIHDVAADLAHYDTPSKCGEIDGAVRPARREDIEALMVFLRREFPGRWRFETQDYLSGNARISDCMLLWTDRGVDGFCWLTFEDSVRPMERYYPYSLPRPWGHLGPIGVSAACRGLGYGAALLDAGLQRLRDNGVRGCVVDWTSLVDFYAKFGFTIFRDYLPLTKSLS